MSLFVMVEQKTAGIWNQGLYCDSIWYITIAVSCLCCDFHILLYESYKSKSHVTSNIFKNLHLALKHWTVLLPQTCWRDHSLQARTGSHQDSLARQGWGAWWVLCQQEGSVFLWGSGSKVVRQLTISRGCFGDHVQGQPSQWPSK